MNRNRLRKCDKYGVFCEFMNKDGCTCGRLRCPQQVVKVKPTEDCSPEVQINRMMLLGSIAQEDMDTAILIAQMMRGGNFK